MESVRKAAEMVIEEVQIKGQFQMFSVYVCVEHCSILHKTPLIFTCTDDNNETNDILLYFKLNNSN